MFTKGNKYGGKRENAGRKTIKQEVEEARELITQEALISLANSKVYKQMIKTSEDDMVDYVRTKEVALPITLRGITEKRELTGKDGKPLEILFDESFSKRNESTRKSEN